MNYKQKGDGIEGRHWCPTLPPLANGGWDPGWPWDLMLGPSLSAGQRGYVTWGEVGRGGCTDNKVREGPFQSLAIALEGECKIVRH